jgi:hypothetical protein
VASAQIVLQHTPSVQMPLWHWVAAVHAEPLVFFPQVLPTQVLGGTQSVSTKQGSLQEPEAQMEGVQSCVAGAPQAPAPSQVEALLTTTAVAQVAALQFWPLAVYAQSPPTHLPVVPQVADCVAAQMPCGSFELSGTVVHVPAVAVRLQLMHLSLQRPLQHTPWAQKPDLHSAAEAQLAPGPLSPHWKLAQTLTWSVEHWLVLVQVP